MVGTKGEVVRRMRRRRGGEGSLLDRLEVRQVTRQGSFQALPKIRAKPKLGAREGFGTGLSKTKSAGQLALQDREGGSVVKVEYDELRIDRARKRWEEKQAKKEKLQLDLIALKEREKEAEEEKKERMRQIIERDRKERAEKLAQWKAQAREKEMAKARKEEKRKQREKKEKTEALKQRQDKYIAELYEHQQRSAKKKVSSISQSREEEEDSRKPQRGRKKKASHPRKFKATYDPTGKLGHNIRTKKRKPKKLAKDLSDLEIVQMAKNIVQQASQAKEKRNNNNHDDDNDDDGDEVEHKYIGSLETPTTTLLHSSSVREGVVTPTTSLGFTSQIEDWYKKEMETIS